MLRKILILNTALLVVLATSLIYFSNKPTPSFELIKEHSSVEVSPTPTPKANTYSVKKLDLSKSNALLLAGGVTQGSVNELIDQLMELNKDNKPIYLLIDSPGGSVIDGTRLIAAMQSSKNKVSTVCLQICASMGAMILEHGYKRYAVDKSIIMFHPASLMMMVQGELDKAVSQLTFLKRYVDKLDYYVAKRSGQSYDAFKAKTMQELWLDAEDALQENLVDEVVSINISSSYELDFSNKLKEKISLE